MAQYGLILLPLAISVVIREDDPAAAPVVAAATAFQRASRANHDQVATQHGFAARHQQIVVEGCYRCLHALFQGELLIGRQAGGEQDRSDGQSDHQFQYSDSGLEWFTRAMAVDAHG